MDVKPELLGTERWNWDSTRGLTIVIVEISTDEGIVGLGESNVADANAEITKAIVDSTRELLIGEDPFDVEKLTNKMYYSLGFHRDVMEKCYGMSYVGVDMAIWDIIAKACNRPLYKVMGGAVRKKVPFKGSVAMNLDNMDRMAKAAQDTVQQGFRTLYMRLASIPQRRSRQ